MLGAYSPTHVLSKEVEIKYNWKYIVREEMRIVFNVWDFLVSSGRQTSRWETDPQDGPGQETKTEWSGQYCFIKH